MEWLKDILGDGYSEDVALRMTQKLENHFVEKAAFDDLQAESLRTQSQHLEELRRVQRDAVDQRLLLELGAKNKKAVQALLDEVDTQLDEEQYCTLRRQQLAKLAGDADSAFLFSDHHTPALRGFLPGEGADKPCEKTPGDMSYEELCSYFDVH